MIELSFKGKRIGAGILLSIGLFCAANYYLEWHVFGRFDKAVMIGTFLVMFIYLVRVGPTLDEMLDHREARNRKERAPVGLRPWVYFLTVSIVMLVVVLIGPVLQLAKGDPVEREDWIRLIVTEALVVASGIVGWYQMKRLLRRRADRI